MQVYSGHLHSALIIFAMSLSVHAATAADVEFRRDVQPILSEHCLQCHGSDAAQRQAGLRLDLRDVALKGGESGLRAIVPGMPDESELLRRITSDDTDVLMPPPHLNKPLSDPQIATLKQWISDGAKYEAHWAFTAPEKKPVPDVGTAHPVDAFVHERLQREHTTPAPKAADSEICRRIYLDLIGLPPSPQEIADFESTGAEATIDRLLQSERFGEKWARHWLDLARYSDTNGYEKDMQREQWSWRDWVIDAINRDMPYDQFVVEQIAGPRGRSRRGRYAESDFERHDVAARTGAVQRPHHPSARGGRKDLRGRRP